MKNYQNQLAGLFLPVLLFLLVPPVFAGGLIGGDSGEMIWKSGANRYIKLVKQENARFGANDHPVELDAKDIRFALEAITLSKDGLLAEKTEALFSQRQAALLGENLATGLKNAGPDQDIVFVLEKSVPQFIFMTEQVFVAGRTFYKDGKLNIIIGDYNMFRSEELERVYDSSGQLGAPYTFNHGYRGENANKVKGKFEPVAGIQNMILGNKVRNDWFVIDVQTAAQAFLAKRNQDNRSGGQAVDDKAIRLEAARLAKERRELRMEMARMRKEIQESSSGNNNNLSIEERLARLDELRQKDLITADEYEQKRNEILNDI